MIEKRGRKKQTLKNYAIHQELMNNFNINSQKESKNNIFETLSEYNIVFDDIRKIKETTKKEKTVLFGCSRSVSDEISKYATLFSSNIIKIKKIDIINFLLSKIFNAYNEAEIIEMIEKDLSFLNKIGEEKHISCYLEQSLLEKIFAIKIKLKKDGKNIAGFKIISFLLEIGKKKYLPNIKK